MKGKHNILVDEVMLSFQLHQDLYPLRASLPGAELTPYSSPLRFMGNLKEKCHPASVHKSHPPFFSSSFPNSELTFFAIDASLAGSDFKSTMRKRRITDAERCLGA